MKWIVIERNAEGQERALAELYENFEDACQVQEAMEWLHDENAYLIGKVI